MIGGVLTISGERRWDGFFVGVEKIQFEPGAKLVFTQKAMNMGGDLYILAKEIISVSQTNPGTITWERPPLDVPPAKGSATAGGGYPGDDRAGNPGSNGDIGNMGYRGADAPRLTLVAQKTTGPVLVRMDGANGGQGGKGQTGGRGGPGGNGHPASQDLVNCRRGAGDGGPGGKGGDGGPGGPGGTGGNGGTFTVITAADNVALATTLFRVTLTPGAGGTGGPAGDPGLGGDGGQGGQEALPWCRGNGSAGPTGPAGAPGAVGKPGVAGVAGNYLVGALGPTDVDRVLTQ
ncbi:hypothetical protein [Microvirga calopogonii]|uniref:hypothetical protein n=1 Tax=Microvirga calopogonii TaxID=2078013 RepID=UPI0013B35FE5|nr:hypothetical protein [Microvirga calopogonii]